MGKAAKTIYCDVTAENSNFTVKIGRLSLPLRQEESYD
jgi:hypothetical protein